MAFLGDAVAIAAGAFHSCAVRSTGEVLCWGDNVNGQLGDGSRRKSPTVVAARSVQGAVSVAAGFGHTCAVLGGGGMRCWGASERGQLGVDDNQDQLVARAVPVVSGVEVAAAGQQHTCAASARQWWCFGSNTTSQLGDGTTQARETPAPVSRELVSSPGR